MREFSHNFEGYDPGELERVLELDRMAAQVAARNRAISHTGNRGVDDLYEYDLRTALVGRQIHVDCASVYESSHHLAEFVEHIHDKDLAIDGIWLCTRSAFARRATPYVHIQPLSARGIWLEDTNYTILEQQPTQAAS